MDGRVSLLYESPPCFLILKIADILHTKIIRRDFKTIEEVEKLIDLSIVEKLGFLRQDFFTRFGGYKKTDSTSVIDNPLLLKAIIASHHCVGINLKVARIFPHRREACISRIVAIQDFVANPVGYLDIDSFVAFLENQITNV